MPKFRDLLQSDFVTYLEQIKKKKKKTLGRYHIDVNVPLLRRQTNVQNISLCAGKPCMI